LPAIEAALMPEGELQINLVQRECGHDIFVTDIVNSEDELAPLMPYNVAIWHLRDD
jgi:hypothetical protein